MSHYSNKETITPVKGFSTTDVKECLSFRDVKMSGESVSELMKYGVCYVEQYLK